MLSCSTLEEGWGDIFQTVASSVNENMKRTEHGKKKKRKEKKVLLCGQITSNTYCALLTFNAPYLCETTTWSQLIKCLLHKCSRHICVRQAGAAWQVQETCPSVDTLHNPSLLLERKQQSQVSMTSAGVR